VDDGSTDATRSIAQARARVVSQTNQGAAAARNLGAANARGDIVLFVDGDCVPDARWIDAMVAPFADADIVGVGGMKQTKQRGILPRFIQMEFDYRYDRVRQHRYIDFVDSGTAAYRRDVFLKSGGFDTRLRDAEDVDLSYRLSEQGCRMAFAADAIVYDPHPESAIEYLRRKFTYAYWRSFVYAKFPRKVASDSRTPQTQKIQTALAGLLPLALVAGIVWRDALWLAALVTLLLVLTTLPFVAKYWRRAGWIVLVAPVLIALAAFAVMSGVVLGVLAQRRGIGH
ncbi:MAG: glycosyltransferase, partial [Chloroflexota bacterium]|nr:glycosyltransferase [Chloroflexota bacterium]